MKRFPLFCLAALLGVAVSAPAQISIEGRIGRHVVGKVTVGHDHHDHARGHRDARRVAPVVRHHVEPVLRRPAAHGHWQTVEEQVLVPGFWQEQHTPPTYGWVTDDCGHRRWGVVAPGGCRQVWVPARWETRTRRVWVPC